ncbi:hypothetical protein P0L94_01345 [Microbacter sp. GSS18]|nr:hypothetical protein P0L94_01345 [Microbacter sp. GSS18]
MAGAASSLAVAAAVGACAVALVAVAAAAGHGQRVAAAADAAALAAADAASGAITGYPCERATQVARALGADVLECDLAGLVATIAVSGGSGAMRVVATSRAGPPP